MKVQERIKEIVDATRHSQMAVTTTSSLDKAKEFIRSLKSNLVETHVMSVTSTRPQTKVENVKIGKLIGEEQEGTAKRHKATCEVVTTTKTEIVYYVIILQSNRDMRRRVENTVGTNLQWQQVADIRGQEVVPAGTLPDVGDATEAVEE